MIRSMPKGPQGQKRPADAIGRAIMVAKIATGEVEDTTDAAASYQSKGGKRGGVARANKLTPEQRSEIAALAAQARWKKSD